MIVNIVISRHYFTASKDPSFTSGRNKAGSNIDGQFVADNTNRVTDGGTFILLFPSCKDEKE